MCRKRFGFVDHIVKDVVFGGSAEIGYALAQNRDSWKVASNWSKDRWL